MFNEKMLSKLSILAILFLSQIALAEISDSKPDEREPAAARPRETVSAPNLAAKNGRNYPGGRDEEDLKVQESLPVPTAKIDRRAIEAKVLKINTEKVNSEEAESAEQ